MFLPNESQSGKLPSVLPWDQHIDNTWNLISWKKLIPSYLSILFDN